MSEFTSQLASWLITYLLHSTLLLGLVFGLERFGRVRSGALLEGLWRAALFGALFTSLIQVGFRTPLLHGEFQVPGLATTSSQTVPVVSHERAATDTDSNVIVGKGATATVSSDTAPSRKPAVGELATRSSGNLLESTTARDLAQHWPLALLFFWLVIATLGLTRVVVAALGAKRELTGRVRVRSGHVLEILYALCRDAGVRRVPMLSTTPSIAGPVSLPNHEICLPQWTLECLDERQLRAMLAHELGHCVRHDPRWLLAGTLLGYLLCIQPLNFLARTRLAASAELACDDWAAAHTGDGKALAECLAECAQRIHASRLPAFASAMAGPRSAFMQRVTRLLKGIPSMTGQIDMKSRISILVALIAVALAAPGFLVTPTLAATHGQQTLALEKNNGNMTLSVAPIAAALTAPGFPVTPPRAAKHDQQTTIMRDNDNGNMTLSISTAGFKARVYAYGRYKFNGAGNDIAVLADGSEVDIETTENGIRRRATFTGVGNSIVRRFYVNGREKTFDADAGKWVAKTLPKILRETAIHAKHRVARMLSRGGPAAVLAEIDKTHSNYARGVYIKTLAESGKLDGNVVDRLIALASGIDSDYSKAQTLAAIYTTQQPYGARLSTLLKAGGGIDSDYQMSQLLKLVARKIPLDKSTLQTYLSLAGKISSNYDLHIALVALLERKDLKPADAIQVMELAARHIDSSYDLKVVLTQAVTRVDNSNAAVSAYCRAAARIDSSYDRREALSALLHFVKLQETGYLALLETASTIDSDYDRSSILMEVARRMPKTPALKWKYRQVAESINSDYDRRRAEEALGL